MALAGRAARSVAEGGELHEANEPEPDELPRYSTVAIDPRSVAVERKVALLRRANEVARGLDTRIHQVTASYGESVQEVLIANSDGLFRTDTRVRLNLAVQAVAKQGDVLESGFEAIRGTAGFEMLTDKAVEEAASDAARRAALNVGAEPAPAGKYTVVLSSEAGGTLIHESVGHGLEADLNLKGLSVYSDRKHAEKLGIERSGNARRESFRYLPICRMTTTMIAPGTSDPEEILKSVSDGVFVKKMGGGQVDVVSGNFAFEITECYRIRDGKLAEPLRGATLVGQGPKLMSEIDMVGSDLGYSTGTCGKDGQGAPVVVGGKLK
jgi:TldD protein